MVLDSFRDIIKHTYGLGFIDMVKLVGSDDGVVVQAMDNDRTVVLYGKLKAPIENLDCTIGLSRLAILNGYLNFSPFSSEKATVQVETVTRSGEKLPCEITFDSNQGHVATYRFMSAEIAEEQIKVPPFKGAVWKVVIKPSKGSMRDLASMNNILGSFESTFTVKTNGSELEFHIGTGASDKTKIVFAKDIKGELKHAWQWPIQQVLSILKLHDSSESCTMSFSDQGALKIDINSGLGTYEFILPARTQ